MLKILPIFKAPGTSYFFARAGLAATNLHRQQCHLRPVVYRITGPPKQ